MMTFIRLLILLWVGAPLVAAADAQPVRPLGRVEMVATSGFSIEWPMSGFEARFDGATLSAVIEDTGQNWLNVEVDGVVRSVSLKKGRNSYKLFSGAKGAHQIRVTRRTGALEGTTTFIEIVADGLKPTQPAARRILVIGDSISAGYGVEGPDQHCPFSRETQNAGAAWPALLAKAYSADLQLISVDGRGLFRNYDGDQPTMAALMERVLPSREAIWRGQFPAQLIVVNLGTNDFSAGDPGPGFETTYLQLLSSLRAKHPKATIIAAIGAMLDGAMLAKAKATVNGVVAKRRAGGDDKTFFVYFDPPANGRRFGCNWHPGMDAQKYMAQTLQAVIEPSLGWQKTAVN